MFERNSKFESDELTPEQKKRQELSGLQPDAEALARHRENEGTLREMHRPGNLPETPEPDASHIINKAAPSPEHEGPSSALHDLNQSIGARSVEMIQDDLKKVLDRQVSKPPFETINDIAALQDGDEDER
jgi:hypothetical protein